MAELRVRWEDAPQEKWQPPTLGMTLYCLPCETVHPFRLRDIEKMFYALDINSALSKSECLNFVRGYANSVPSIKERVELRKATP